MNREKYFNEILKVALKNKRTTDIKYSEIGVSNEIAISINPTLTMFIDKADFLFDLDILKNKVNLNYFLESELEVNEGELILSQLTNKVTIHEGVEYTMFKVKKIAGEELFIPVLVERKLLAFFDSDCFYKVNKQMTRLYVYEKSQISGYIQTLNGMIDRETLERILK